MSFKREHATYNWDLQYHEQKEYYIWSLTTEAKAIEKKFGAFISEEEWGLVQFHLRLSSLVFIEEQSFLWLVMKTPSIQSSECQNL